MFECMECGEKYDADKAEYLAENGCANCGGSDIDLGDVPTYVDRVLVEDLDTGEVGWVNLPKLLEQDVAQKVVLRAMEKRGRRVVLA